MANTMDQEGISVETVRCVFLSKNGQCELLNRTICPRGGCSFLILPEEEARRQASWAERLSHLDDARQKEISKKYYGGGKPWREK